MLYAFFVSAESKAAVLLQPPLVLFLMLPPSPLIVKEKIKQKGSKKVSAGGSAKEPGSVRQFIQPLTQHLLRPALVSLSLPNRHSLTFAAVGQRNSGIQMSSAKYLFLHTDFYQVAAVQMKRDRSSAVPHFYDNNEELADNARYTPEYKNLYAKRKETIERVFADAKEKCAMHYTLYRGLTQVSNWVRLKFASMNLKKLTR